MKKVIALIICAVMIISSCTFVFADELDGALTVAPVLGTAAPLIAPLIAPATQTEVLAPFKDCVKGAWYEESLAFCVANGLMKGTSDTTIEPERDITRAEIVEMLYRLAGKPEPTKENVFTDVAAGSWYEKAVAWAKGEGIVDGTSETTFEPENNVTREQLLTMIFRYGIYDAEKNEGNVNLFYPNLALTYADAEKISDWATSAVRWGTADKIVNGKDGNLFDPQGYATRAEAAAMFSRFGKTPEKVETPISLAGGWTAADMHEEINAQKMPEDAIKAFNEAFKGLLGVKVKIVAYLGSQVVAGTNYAYICEVTPVVPNAASKLVVYKVYADLEGNFSILDSFDLTEANIATTGSIVFPGQGVVGGFNFNEAVGGMDAVEYGTAGATEKYGLQGSAKEALEKALKDLVGVKYEPMVLLGTQVVAGVNYSILCKVTPVVPNASSAIGAVRVYAGVDGTTSITPIGNFVW